MNSRLVHWLARAALLYAFAGFTFDAFAEDVVPSDEAIKAAVAKSLPLLETGARGFDGEKKFNIRPLPGSRHSINKQLCHEKQCLESSPANQTSSPGHGALRHDEFHSSR
jgi:hypothetical protein